MSDYEEDGENIEEDDNDFREKENLNAIFV
jgi:hypothetical protein